MKQEMRQNEQTCSLNSELPNHMSWFLDLENDCCSADSNK